MNKRENDGKWKNLRRKWLSDLEDHTCAGCGKAVDISISGSLPEGPTADHIIPYSIAPELRYDVTNLQLMHKVCNQRKHVKTDYKQHYLAGINYEQRLKQPQYSDGTYWCRYDDVNDMYVNVGGNWSGNEYEVTFESGVPAYVE